MALGGFPTSPTPILSCSICSVRRSWRISDTRTSARRCRVGSRSSVSPAMSFCRWSRSSARSVLLRTRSSRLGSSTLRWARSNGSSALYFCADGWSDRSGVHFGSKSKVVCQALKRMLLRCGIISNLNHREIRDHGTHWTLSIADKGQAKEFLRSCRSAPHRLDQVREGQRGGWRSGAMPRVRPTSASPRRSSTAELDRRCEVTGTSKRQLGVDTGGYATSQGRCIATTLDGSALLRTTRGSPHWRPASGTPSCRSSTWARRSASTSEMSDPERPVRRGRGLPRPQLRQEEPRAHPEGAREVRRRLRHRTGTARSSATSWFDIIEPFADYAFNKSHSYGYGYVAYQTAYLKANYPVEYLAVAAHERQDQPRQGGHLPQRVPPDGHPGAGARRQRVAERLRRPCPTSTTAQPARLDPVRPVGGAQRGQRTRRRSSSRSASANGPYVDFYDFCERVDMSVLNKRTIESLIKAGGFDSLGHPRKGLLAVFEHDHRPAPSPAAASATRAS